MRPLLLLIICALFTLACDSASTTDDASPQAPQAALTGPQKDLLQGLATAHQTIHKDKPAPTGVSESLSQAIQRNGTFREALEAFYQQAGPCALVCRGDLTHAGRALLRWLDDLDRHAINKKPFQIKLLHEEIAAWRELTGAQKLTAEVKGGDYASTALDLVRAPTWDPKIAAERLGEATGDVPDSATIEQWREALLAQKAEPGPQEQKRTLGLRASMAEALARTVLELRFARRASPKKVTKDDELLVEQVQDALVKDMLSVVQAADADKALEALWPEEPEYRQMLKQHARYLKIAKEGCPKLPPDQAFEGEVEAGPAVKKLQERLKCEGYYEGELNGTWSALTRDAVKLYQRHHDYEETGEVTTSLLKSINVPLDRRAKQVGLALQRIRDSRLKDMGDFFIIINLPSFQMRVYEDGEVVRRHKVIIGSNKLDDDKYALTQGHINRTDLFQTNLYEVVINPDWILPPRVSKGELVGNLEKNKDYLKENNIKQIKLASGKTAYAQGVGRGNVLGKVKFLLEKSSAIYLHDTNERILFRKRHRAFSHGCIRVHEASEFAKWLLIHDGQDRRDMERSLNAQKVQRGVTLNTPVPIATVYRTVELSEAGLPVFYSDVYHYDRAYLAGKLPVKESSRWGDSILRPHWVPTVPYNQYKVWKKAGKPAPRNLKPGGAEKKGSKKPKKK